MLSEPVVLTSELSEIFPGAGAEYIETEVLNYAIQSLKTQLQVLFMLVDAF
jgi:hypothetical protein